MGLNGRSVWVMGIRLHFAKIFKHVGQVNLARKAVMLGLRKSVRMFYVNSQVVFSTVDYGLLANLTVL